MVMFIECYFAECRYAGCRASFVYVFTILSIATLSIMLSVFMLSVVILSVLVPYLCGAATLSNATFITLTLSIDDLAGNKSSRPWIIVTSF